MTTTLYASPKLCRLMAVAALCVFLCLTAHAQRTDMFAQGVRQSSPYDPQNAVDLDGSTEYLTDIGTNVVNAVTSCTVSVWVNLRLSQNYSGIVSSYPGAGNNRCWISTANLGSNFRFDVGNGTASCSVQNNATSVTNIWTHLVGTWVSGSHLYLYINGVRFSDATISGAIRQTVPFLIGSLPSNAKFPGLVDDVAIFANRAWTSNEVVEAWNNGTGKQLNQLSTGTNGLVRYWDFNPVFTASNTNAYDSASGTYATGTAIGAGDTVTGIVPLIGRP